MEMGNRIRDLRRAKGLTQSELAEKVGVNDSAIAKYENGRIENLKRSTIAALAKALDCSPVYLLCLEDETVEKRKEKPDYTIEEINLIESFRNADDSTKEMINRLLAYNQLMNEKK